MRKKALWVGGFVALALSLLCWDNPVTGTGIQFPDLVQQPNYTLVDYHNSMQAYWPLGPYAAFAKVIVYDMAYIDAGKHNDG